PCHDTLHLHDVALLPATIPDPHPFPTRRSSDLEQAAQSLPPSSSAWSSTAQCTDRRRPSCQKCSRHASVTPACRSPIKPHRSLPDRKSTRLNSSHVKNSYAVFCLKKKTITDIAR